MSFITESQLAAYRTQTKTFSAESLENVFESSFDNKAKVFLSHKHDEGKILQDVVALLKKEGVDVYIDWLDEGMPAFTNAKTAHRLKEKIKIADKFILLATEKAINSKWCNWELGLGDAAKYVKNNIALFPITKDNGNFQQITAQNAGVFQVFALVVQIANQRFLLPIGAGFWFSCHRFVL